MLRKLKLFGVLGKKYGKEHQFDVRTTGEAVRAMDANFPGFLQEVQRLSTQGYAYKVTTGKHTKVRATKLDDLVVPVSGDIRITPVVGGAKSAGFSQLIMGAVIAIAAFYTGGAASAMAAAAAEGASTMAAIGAGISSLTGMYAVAFQIGVSLAIGGVVQLLTPAPSVSASKEADKEASYIFGGVVNTSAQGNPVPIGYGELIVGSSVISAGIVTESLTVGVDPEPLNTEGTLGESVIDRLAGA